MGITKKKRKERKSKKLILTSRKEGNKIRRHEERKEIN